MAVGNSEIPTQDNVATEPSREEVWGFLETVPGLQAKLDELHIARTKYMSALVTEFGTRAIPDVRRVQEEHDPVLAVIYDEINTIGLEALRKRFGQ